ncbi:MAG: SIS domain-containing protein [Clostridia bacterium]|nr:SIS domain-containing protein [Clostridia bacterium]
MNIYPLVDLLLRQRLDQEQKMMILAGEISRVCEIIIKALEGGRRIYALGNGGSAAEAEHLVTELVGRFRNQREGLKATALTTNTSLLTALANDFGYDQIFARQVAALVESGDVVMGFSTGGQSPNVLAAMAAARRQGALTVALTGAAGAALVKACDLALLMPSHDTPVIQEMHQKVIHIISQVVDDHFGGKAGERVV